MQTYKRSADGEGLKAGLLFFLPFTILALILTLALFLVAAAVYAFTPMGQTVLSVTAVTISLVCVLASGFLAGRTGGAPGWLYGGMTGLSYGVIAVILALAMRAVPILSAKPPLMLLIYFVCGAAGGVLGINLRAKKRYRRWK